MALAVKHVTRTEKMAVTQGKEIGDVTSDDVIVALTADLQQLQDEETKGVIEMLPEMVCFNHSLKTVIYSWRLPKIA